MNDRAKDVKPRHGCAILLSLAIGAAVAWAAYALNVSADTRETSRYEAVLRELSTQNFRRTSELLLVRSGLVRHYDHLAAIERNLRDLHSHLQKPPDSLSEPSRADLLRLVARSDMARMESEQLVEDFKRKLSILNNSAGFLTTLSRDVAAFEPTTSSGMHLAQMLNGVLQNLLNLEVTHEQQVELQARSALFELRAEIARAKEWSATDLNLVVRHGELIIEMSLAVDGIVRRLATLPTTQLAEELLSTYLRAHRASMDRQRGQRSLLVAFLFLAGSSLAMYVIFRLRRAASELRRTGMELLSAVDSLKEERNKQTELAELKSRFVSTTSHEFRTPLSVIFSSAEMLSAYADVWSKEKKEQHLSRIRASASSMTRMLEDVLLLGQAESGRLNYTPASFDLPEFCRELTAMAEQATGNLGRINCIYPQSPTLVMADENLLRHALGNLLSNALKYSPKEEKVNFAAEVTADALRFIVQDRGIGIPHEDQRHLFSSFQRGSNVGRVSGTGLGLSIVKHAVDLQSGEIFVNSTLGHGTEVQINIPVHEAAQ